MGRRVIVMSRVSPSPRTTEMVTSVPGSPISMPMHSSTLRPSVERPSMATTRSLAMTPAFQAGESSSGERMVNQPSRRPTSAPMPTYAPVRFLLNSAVSWAGTNSV